MKKYTKKKENICIFRLFQRGNTERKIWF